MEPTNEELVALMMGALSKEWCCSINMQVDDQHHLADCVGLLRRNHPLTIELLESIAKGDVDGLPKKLREDSVLATMNAVLDRIAEENAE